MYYKKSSLPLESKYSYLHVWILIKANFFTKASFLENSSEPQKHG